MIPAKIDPNSITAISELGIESIIDWFDQQKQSFYTIGMCYLQSQQQLEELFYQSIIQVEKEWPRFKNKTSLETWVTSIFMNNCRELSRNKSFQASEENENDLIKALYQLAEYEKDAIVLTYIKGYSQELVANILQISKEKLKDFLFSGIQLFRNEMNFGSTFNGCTDYQKDYIDYLERAMERTKKIDFEVHIYHCQDCQEDLASFQNVMLTLFDLPNMLEDLYVTSSFMENVKERIAEKERHRIQKIRKRKRMGLVFASAFALLISLGFFTGAFTYLYYTWTEEDPELRAFLQQNLGERLNLEAESNGVKIKIKSVIADDIQTLVLYEIEDTNKDNQYMMGFRDGAMVENELEILNRGTYPKYYPPNLKSEINSKVKNVYHGKMSLLPLKTENGTIKLKVTRIQKLESDSSNGYPHSGEIEFKTGDWRFEIPVTKKPSIEYALNGQTEVEGIPIRFDKLTIAPTTTILQFAINNTQTDKRVHVLQFNTLEVNNKIMKSDMHGSSYLNTQNEMNWSTLQTQFDPLFGEKPKKISIGLASAYLSIEDNKTIQLDHNQEYPHIFEYAGSTISIDEVEVDKDTKIVISNHNIENRAYDSLDFNIISENGIMPNSTEMNSEGVLVDKNGVIYDVNNMPVSYEEIEQPRYLYTVQSVRFKGFKGVPGKLEIFGYSTIKYLEDVVEVSLDKGEKRGT